MSDISGVSNTGTVPGRLVGRAVTIDRTAEPARPHPATRPSDRVELSDRARLLAHQSEPPVRQDLIQRVRAEIEAGTYETPERLDGALRALADDLEPRA